MKPAIKVVCACEHTIGRHQALGDFLCIFAALAQCLSLVRQEFLIKEEISIVDFMAMLGFSGTLVASIQL